MTRLDYIDLFTKKVIGSISKSEKELLDKLSKDPETKQDIDSLQNLWNDSANYSPKVSFNSTQAFKKFKENNINTAESAINSSKGFSTKFLLSLLSISILSIAIFFLYNGLDDNASNARSIKNFSIDGTQVWLNTNAELNSEKSNEGVEVLKINGSVYLDNSQSKDLVIDELNHQVLLKSAKASISKDERKGLEISIEEGTASLVVDTKTIEIRSGETLQLNRLGQIHIGRVRSKNTFTWRINTLQFNNTPMDVVIRDLERYYGIKIDSKVTNLDDCFFTSPILTNTELKTVFEILKSSHKAEFIAREDMPNRFDLTSINCL